MLKGSFILGVGLVAMGCVRGEPDELVVAAPDNGEQATDVAAAPDVSPPERKAGWAVLDLVPYAPSEQTAIALGPVPSAPLELRSREELAEALRPVVSRPDGLFMTREPNWVAADSYHRQVKGWKAEATAPATPGAPVDIPPDQIQTAGAIIGGDGRTLVTNTTVLPFAAMARVVITLDTGNVACTGTYIGPWTFVLAGHCVRSSDGSVARRMVFEPARNGATLPFGSFDCRNDDATTANDYLLAIPSAFAATADPGFDFAVMDTFPCHRAPRWIGQPATNAGILVDTGTVPYGLHGYPGPACPGAPSGSFFNCGMFGSGYVNGPWLESEFIDSDHGQSGAAWHFAGRVAGTHIGYREYFDLFRCGFDVCRRNYARRIDSGYKAFLDAIAFDYP
jgi:V8-like Glu-specific endopeptidase